MPNDTFAEYRVERQTHVMPIDGPEPEWWGDESVAFQIAQGDRLIYSEPESVKKMLSTQFRSDAYGHWVEFRVVGCSGVPSWHVEPVAQQLDNLQSGLTHIRLAHSSFVDVGEDRRDILPGDVVIIPQVSKNQAYVVVRVEGDWATLRKPEETRWRTFFMPRNMLTVVKRPSGVDGHRQSS